jgi:hypothetical protein
MPAAQYDFAIEQGATTIRSFVWKSSDGTPVDLTGYAARMQVRRSVSAADVLLEASTFNNRIQLDPLAGRITLVLPADVTAAINWTRGRYDIELVSPDGDVTRLVQGEITVSKEITRD